MGWCPFDIREGYNLAREVHQRPLAYGGLASVVLEGPLGSPVGRIDLWRISTAAKLPR